MFEEGAKSLGELGDIDYENDYSLNRINCEKALAEASGSFICKDDKDYNAPSATYDLTVLSI